MVHRAFGSTKSWQLGASSIYGACGSSPLSLKSVCFAGFLAIAWAPRAEALPSFARQTGQPCGTCHTDFLALTPYGRRFKLLLRLYRSAAAMFRTTPFPIRRQCARRSRQDGPVPQGRQGAGKRRPKYVPPVAMMAIIGYTHTQSDLTPPTDPWKPNDQRHRVPGQRLPGAAPSPTISGLRAGHLQRSGPGGNGGDPFAFTPGPGTTPMSLASVKIREYRRCRRHSSALRSTIIRPCRTSGIRRRPGLSLRAVDHRQHPLRPAPRLKGHSPRPRGRCRRLRFHRRPPLSRGELLSHAQSGGAERGRHRSRDAPGLIDGVSPTEGIALSRTGTATI